MMQTLQELLRYPAVHGLTQFAMAAAWAVVAGIALIALIHTSAALGNRTVMYRAGSPPSGWSKRFYPACFLMVAILWGIAAWLQGLSEL